MNKQTENNNKMFPASAYAGKTVRAAVQLPFSHQLYRHIPEQ